MNQRLLILAKWMLQDAFLPRCPSQIWGPHSPGAHTQERHNGWVCNL